MPINHALQRPLEDYIAFLESLTPRSVPLLGKYVASSVRYKDPFQDVIGAEEAAHALAKIFDTIGRPKFRVTDVAWGRDDYTVYLRWMLTADDLRIDGVAELMFGLDGKVIAHINHWDSGSQVLARLPVVKWVWHKVRQKIAA